MQWILETIGGKVEKLPAFREWTISLSHDRLLIINHHCVHDDKTANNYYSYPKIIATINDDKINISNTFDHNRILNIADPNTTPETIIAIIQQYQSEILSSSLRWIA